MKKILFYLKLIGINPISFFRFFYYLPVYLLDLRKIKKQSRRHKTFEVKKLYPCLFDKYSLSGNLAPHYFFQDLYVARKIYVAKPVKHVDIGSRIDGFIAHLAVFREVEVFDIRPLEKTIYNVRFIKADISSADFAIQNYADSVSSLHVIEHFGLGRYGDPIDVDSYLKGLSSIYQLLKPGGKFYFSVPIGNQRIEFNAHRVFSLSYLLELFKEKYHVDSFSFIDDEDKFYEEVELTVELILNNCRCNFGCGIFILTKK